MLTIPVDTENRKQTTGCRRSPIRSEPHARLLAGADGRPGGSADPLVGLLAPGSGISKYLPRWQYDAAGRYARGVAGDDLVLVDRSGDDGICFPADAGALTRRRVDG